MEDMKNEVRRKAACLTLTENYLKSQGIIVKNLNTNEPSYAI